MIVANTTSFRVMSKPVSGPTCDAMAGCLKANENIELKVLFSAVKFR